MCEIEHYFTGRTFLAGAGRANDICLIHLKTHENASENDFFQVFNHICFVVPAGEMDFTSRNYRMYLEKMLTNFRCLRYLSADLYFSQPEA